MAIPTTRDEFAEYCLRALGKPAIQIEVFPEQVDDRIDEALKFYWDYHYDGSEKVYLKHEVTANNVADGYITVPENIIGVVKIFNPTSTSSSVGSAMFDVQYQIMMSEIWSMQSLELAPYVSAMTHLSTIEHVLVGQKPFRYTRHRNRLHIDTDWSKIRVGSFLLAECYMVIDPEEFPNVWGDLWFQRYAIALIRRQWGENISKYGNVILPGGMVINSERIIQTADRDIALLEVDATTRWSIPVLDDIG